MPAIRLNICDLPRDVLCLILSSLHGQDVARCIAVCHSFSDLIHSDLALQYRIELAQNGMVDGEGSTLPVSERLQRLRQYSSNFNSGTFQHEDLTAHPDYVVSNNYLLGQLQNMIPSGRPSRTLHNQGGFMYLSLFVPGSVQGGIPSSRSLFTIRETVKPGMIAETWALDYVEDLFVMVEMTRTTHEERMAGRIPEVFIYFYSLSGLKTGTMTPHPTATLPFIHLHVVESAKPTMVFQLQILGDYVIFEIRMEMGEFDSSYYIDVYNWKTGQMVSRTNIGKVLVSIVPLDEPYLLLFPCTRMPYAHQEVGIWIYSFSPSSCESLTGRRICTLQVPPTPPGEYILWSQARTGDHTEETTGHFRADPSRSVVAIDTVLSVARNPIEANNANETDDDHTISLLIPRATLAAQIRAAESTSRPRHGNNARSGSSEDAPRLLADQPPEPTPPCVPWADWGPRGCLRLHLRSPLFRSQHHAFVTPFGSRLPVVMFNGPGNATASMYVFDANPVVARSLRQARVRAARRRQGCDDSDSEGETGVGDADLAAVVEDIEEVLPGVVDPECAAIPYTVYRFPLPYSRVTTGLGLGAVAVAPPDIRAASMSMAGFTVQFDDSVQYEKRFQMSTV